MQAVVRKYLFIYLLTCLPAYLHVYIHSYMRIDATPIEDAQDTIPSTVIQGSSVQSTRGTQTALGQPPAASPQD